MQYLGHSLSSEATHKLLSVSRNLSAVQAPDYCRRKHKVEVSVHCIQKWTLRVRVEWPNNAGTKGIIDSAEVVEIGLVGVDGVAVYCSVIDARQDRVGVKDSGDACPGNPVQRCRGAGSEKAVGETVGLEETPRDLETEIA